MPSDNTDITDKNLYRFSDLVDVPTFARMLESYFRATGIPNGVVDASGELLSLSAGENVCTLFHRTNPKSEARCRESNLAIMRDLHDGCIAGGLCRHGLMDYATPVVIEGRQLVTLFLGQILHEPPDLEFFRKQAAELGFDEKSYLDAIKAIPVVDNARLRDHMNVMVEMARMLAASGLARMRQAALERDLGSEVERSVQLKEILDFCPVAIGWSDGESRIEYVNRQFTERFGYTVDDFPDMETGYRLLFPGERYQEIAAPWNKAVAQARQTGTAPPELEADIGCKDGSVRRVVVSTSWVGRYRMASFTDITERKRFELQLAKNERQWRTLVENIPDNIARYTTDARHTYISTLLEVVNGKPKEYFLGRTPMECFPDGRYAEYERRIRAVAASGTADTMEMAIEMPDGETQYHLIRFIAERNAAGCVDGVLAIGEDITARKRTELALAAREREFRTLAQNLPDTVVRYDRDIRFVYVNPAFEAALGIRADVLYGKPPTEIPGLVDAELFEQSARRVAESGVAIEFEQAMVRVGGRSVRGLVRVTPEFDEAGQVKYVQVLTRDITERWRSEQRIQAHDAMLEMVARGAELSDVLTAIVRHEESDEPTSLCSILLLDNEGKHLLTGAAPSLPAFYNQAIHGLEIGVGVGSCGTAAALGQRVIVEDIQTHEYWKPYTGLAQKAGLRSCWSEPILSSHGKVLGTFAIYHAEPKSPQSKDIDRIAFAANLAAIAIENRYAHDELERRAYIDFLTGLANRRHFLERAESELARTLRYGRELSLLMLDLDHFKHINDTYGHKVGDIVLNRFSELCRTALRDVDIAGRLGGEEFAVLLPETDWDQALEVAERLRTTILATQIPLGSGLPLRFSVSIGVAALADKDTNIDMLLHQADLALYRAKSEGRNRVCMYLGDKEPQ